MSSIIYFKLRPSSAIVGISSLERIRPVVYYFLQKTRRRLEDDESLTTSRLIGIDFNVIATRFQRIERTRPVAVFRYVHTFV